MSRAKSQTSFCLNKVDSQRIVGLNYDLTQKLSYEWKNIYRSLLAKDVLQKGKVSLETFNEVLESHGVRLTPEELRRLVRMSKNLREKTQSMAEG